MQLLHSRVTPCAEFASLSLLFKGDISGDQISCRMGEPLLLPSPCTTVSNTSCVESLMELHQYINSVFKATRTNKEDQDKTIGSMFAEEEKSLNDIQVYRPVRGHGIGLHYRLIRDRSLISQLIPLIFSASKTTASDGKGIETSVTGVILCVGFAGLPFAIPMSSLHYSLKQRIKDCLDILGRTGTEDTVSSRALLTTLLVGEEEERLDNTMAIGVSRTLLSDADDSGEHKKAGKLLGKKKGKSSGPVEEVDQGANFTMNSADAARNMVERLAVLSVAESDTIFRKFEGKTNEGDKSSTKSRRGKKGRDADLDGFDFKGESRASQRTSNVPTPTKGAINTVSSPVPKLPSKGLQLQKPKKDTARTKRQSSVPALMASRKDPSRNRRGSIGSSATGSRSNRRAKRGGDTTDTNMFAFDEPDDIDDMHMSGQIGNTEESPLYSGKAPITGSVGNRSARSRQNYDPFASQSEATQPTSSESSASSGRKGLLGEDQEYTFGGNSPFGNDIGHSGGRSSRSLGVDSQSSNVPRVLVNLALNEDLTCFYKLSKMSSCSVEGVLQVQVKSNMKQAVPFALRIRDHSGHIESLQENKKFAENTSSALAREQGDDRPDHQFTVSVPSTDSYFPVMRYRCSNDLRPVPIRVQTRVRREETHWRVALQISSNPHNEDNLTDLTIIMGVPTVVRGESLTTSPPGGVWNALKRSVIWCVSELGGGEKFQLQARFETEHDAEQSDENPKFPVLVRCQCMYAQLSDVEVQVADIPEILTADVKMKLARRFRLSHRERP